MWIQIRRLLLFVKEASKAFQERTKHTKVVVTGTLRIDIPFNIYKPRHEISNNVVCATSKASDQPAHMRSLIRAFASRLNIL